MHKQIFLAKFSKFGYKLTYGTGLIRSKFMRKMLQKRVDSGKKLFPDLDGLVCLPKNNLININKSIKKKPDTLLPTQVIDHFIDKSDYRAIMNYCMCRDSNKCKDYPIELGCLFMGEAAEKIHPDLCRPASKAEAKAHIRKCSEAGLVHTAGRTIFDAIWLNVKPAGKLFTVCNCCPCCCITTAFPYMPKEIGSSLLIKTPGIDIEVNGNCTLCGKCVESCVYGGIELSGDRAVITDECKTCGRCVEICPQKALNIKITDKNYIRKTIEFLEPKVDFS